MFQANQTSNTKSGQSSGHERPLFDRAVTAERLWRQHADAVWSQISAGTPEYERADLENSVLGDGYEALFKEFCDFALANPSLEVMGQVVVLWRLRCWDENGSIGEMADDFEARTIVRLSEILTGIKH
jgi:hypothetical protein